MYLVDTNVVSALDARRSRAAADLVAWLNRNHAVLYLSPVTILEIEVGRLKLARTGRDERAAEIQAMLDLVHRQFMDRLLPIGVDVALAAAALAERCRAQVVDVKDLLIAATAQVHGFTVLTRKLRHFRPTGVPAIDPFESLPPDA